MLHRYLCLVLIVACLSSIASAQGIPLMVNYQGQVKDNGLPYDGVGYFKFALVNAAGDTTYWSNDGTSTAGSEPTDGVTRNVTGGLFEVKLGDTSLANMAAIPATAIGSPDIRLRLWFSADGANYTLLAPDKQLTSVPYAYVAERVADNAIRGPELRRESVWPEHEGRSNTIVSYFATGLTLATDYVTLGTVPAGKTYVITDVIYGSMSSDVITEFTLVLAYEKNANITVLGQWRTASIGYSLAGLTYGEPTRLLLKGGLPVPEGATIKAKSIRSTPVVDVTISGFEFQN